MKISDYIRLTGTMMLIILSAIYHWFWLVWIIMIITIITLELTAYHERLREKNSKMAIDILKKIQEMKRSN